MVLLTHVILTFNDFDYLKRAVQNSLNQKEISIAEREILIIDDGSHQLVKNLLSKTFDLEKNNIHIIRNRENLGIQKSLNVALKRAKSKYIYLGSSNDIILPHFFKEILEELEKYPNAPLCFSNPGIFDEQKNLYKDIKLFLSKEPVFWNPDQLAKIYRKSPFHIGSNTAILRTEAVQQVGIKEDLGLYTDWYLSYVLAFWKGCVYIPQNLTYLTMHENAYSSLCKRNNNTFIMEKFFEYAQKEAPLAFEYFKKTGFISAFPLGEILRTLNKKQIRSLITVEALLFIVTRALWQIFNSWVPIKLKNQIRNWLFKKAIWLKF